MISAADTIIWGRLLFDELCLAVVINIIEGVTLIILGLFIYFWTVVWEPVVTLSQVACNISIVSRVLSQTCAEINLKSSIISYTPYVAIVIAIFGGFLLVKGIIISSRKRRYMWGR
jgi:ABC-type transport system involved in multi-copper enzyme maturation permease subunit